MLRSWARTCASWRRSSPPSSTRWSSGPVDCGDPAATLGEALLDQRIAAGIGNVYKSEACFACRLDPTAPLAAFDAAARRRVWEVAARQLQANLDRPGRRTHPQGVAVYGRAGQPCPSCGTPVRIARHGDLNRSTYWCPRCQPPPTPREDLHKRR